MIILNGDNVETIDLRDDPDAAHANDKKRTVQRVIVRSADGAEESVPHVTMIRAGDGQPNAAKVRVAMPLFGLDETELRTTLAEQGIEAAKADAVIKSLDKKRREAAARVRETTSFARLSIVPLIPSKSGFPMTEGTYLKVRQMSVPSIGERELLERTLKSMLAARENYAHKVGDHDTRHLNVLDALDREIEHLKSKIKRY